MSQNKLTILKFDQSKQSLDSVYDKPLHPEFIIDEGTFFSLNENVYLTDGSILFLINAVKDNYNKTSLVEVTGFEKLQIGEELLKVDSEHKTNEVIMLTNFKLVIYHFNNSTDCTISTFPDVDFKSSIFVDVIYNSSSIYLLEMSKGLYFLKDKQLPELLDMGISENIKYVKMELYNNTIEVIFEYAKEMYVVELLLSNATFYINRYYDEIAGFKEINFFNETAFFIGEDEMLLVYHSIPQRFLLDMGRVKTSYLMGYGMEDFEVVGSLTNQEKLVLLGFNDFLIMLIEFSVARPTLECKFRSEKSAGL